MPPSSPWSLLMPLPRPAARAGTRLVLGRHELVLEQQRGTFSLLWNDGRRARRFLLGLPTMGHLTVQLRAPSLPLVVATRDPLVLAPGARCRGYLQVPLLPTIVWHDAAAGAHVLVELRPDDLTAEWDEARGHTLHAESVWHTRFPMRTDEPLAIVPLRLRNAAREVLSTASLPLVLRNGDLQPCRGALVVRPRQLVWSGEWHEVARRRSGVPA